MVCQFPTGRGQAPVRLSSPLRSGDDRRENLPRRFDRLAHAEDVLLGERAGGLDAVELKNKHRDLPIVAVLTNPRRTEATASAETGPRRSETDRGAVHSSPAERRETDIRRSRPPAPRPSAEIPVQDDVSTVRDLTLALTERSVDSNRRGRFAPSPTTSSVVHYRRGRGRGRSRVGRPRERRRGRE